MTSSESYPPASLVNQLPIVLGWVVNQSTSKVAYKRVTMIWKVVSTRGRDVYARCCNVSLAASPVNGRFAAG